MAMTAPAAAETETVYPVAALRADLDLLRTAFREAHSGLYRYASKAQIDAAFDAAAAKLAQPMDSRQFYRVLAPVIAAVQDGHTRVRLGKADLEAFNANASLLPVRMHVAGGKLYILRDLRAEDGGPSLEGAEVESIDGRPARAILASLGAVLEGDGTIQSSRAAKLRTFRFNTLFALMYDPAASYSVKLRGQAKAVTLNGMPFEALNKAWEQYAPARAPAELGFQQDGAVGVLTIRSFQGFADKDKKVGLDDFLATSFDQLRKRGTGALIIDVRGNGGGEDSLGKLLLSYLLDHDFDYYNGLYLNQRDISFTKNVDEWPGTVPEQVAGVDDKGRLHLLRHPNIGTQKISEPGFRGKVIVLMDGASFSTTAEFLSVLHNSKRAVFVGEESGGGYYGNTSGPVLTLTLPNSKMEVSLPLVRYELAVQGFAPADRGAPPTVTVEPSASEVLAGKDRAMEVALSLAIKR